MRMLCVLSLVCAVWTGYLVFGTRAGASLPLHVGFIASIVVFLVCVVALVAQGASRQIERSSDRIVNSDPQRQRERSQDRRE